VKQQLAESNRPQTLSRHKNFFIDFLPGGLKMDQYITAKDLGKIIGISERRVNQIVTEKHTFDRELNGKFDVAKCVEAYYHDLFHTGLDLDRERALHEIVKREKTELLVAKMKGELHEAADVEKALTDMVITFRNKILGIPSKVAPLLVGQKNIGKIREIIDKEVREALTELSDYDAAMFSGDGIEVEEDEPENNQVIQSDS
jgi:hypothetical protein